MAQRGIVVLLDRPLSSREKRIGGPWLWASLSSTTSLVDEEGFEVGLGREMFVLHIRIMGDMFVLHIRIMGTAFDDSATCVDLGRFMGRLWSAFPTCGPSWSVVSSTNVKPESSLQRDCSLSGRKSCEGRASGESCLPTSACSDAIPE